MSFALGTEVETEMEQCWHRAPGWVDCWNVWPGLRGCWWQSKGNAQVFIFHSLLITVDKENTAFVF